MKTLEEVAHEFACEWVRLRWQSLGKQISQEDLEALFIKHAEPLLKAAREDRG